MKLADAIAAAIDRAVARRIRRAGTVTGTSGTKVIVTVAGSSLTLPRLASYTPVVGDTVHIDTAGNSWLIIGKSA